MNGRLRTLTLVMMIMAVTVVMIIVMMLVLMMVMMFVMAMRFFMLITVSRSPKQIHHQTRHRGDEHFDPENQHNGTRRNAT